jgi:hypothetical protein
MPVRRFFLATPFLGLFLATGPARADEPDPETAFAERTLRDTGVATDGPGLVAYFKSRTPTDADRRRLAEAVRLLGDNAYRIREQATRDLLAAGRTSLTYLRPALNDPDPEIVRRAEECIETIERTPYASVMAAAARVLQARHPPEAAQALLAYLPSVDNEGVEEAVFHSLAVVGLKDGAPLPELAAAVSDKEPLRRAAAAFALGRGAPEVRKPIVRLLNDTDSRVRFQAASALAQAGEREAVPPLVALLSDAPLNLAWQAEDLLFRLADERGPRVSIAGGDKAGRLQCRSAWEAWWKDNGDKADLSRLSREEALLGLNVVTELDGAAGRGGGRIWECGADGKPRWQIENVSRPIDARILPGGRVLVAEHGGSRVTERDREGKVFWEQRTQGQPVSVQRLTNGNTLIATYNQILEVTRDNKVVFTHEKPGMIYNAQKLRDGHIVYVTSNNQVVELDAAGKEVNTITVGQTGGWASVERLASGGYLVALYSARKVVETDRSGRVVWECTVESPAHASRLRNGNTLVASIEGRKIAEYDRSGKEVWSQKTQGRPFHVHRR